MQGLQLLLLGLGETSQGDCEVLIEGVEVLRVAEETELGLVVEAKVGESLAVGLIGGMD